jgi:hypothetical protein
MNRNRNDSLKTMKNNEKESSHFYAALLSGVSDFAKEMGSIPSSKNISGANMTTNKSKSPGLRPFDISKERKSKTCEV